MRRIVSYFNLEKQLKTKCKLASKAITFILQQKTPGYETNGLHEASEHIYNAIRRSQTYLNTLKLEPQRNEKHQKYYI